MLRRCASPTTRSLFAFHTARRPSAARSLPLALPANAGVAHAVFGLCMVRHDSQGAHGVPLRLVFATLPWNSHRIDLSVCVQCLFCSDIMIRSVVEPFIAATDDEQAVQWAIHRPQLPDI